MTRLTRFRLALLLALIGIAANAAQPASAAQLSTTPSLTGEQLNGTLNWKADCNADGTGRITFSASGPATGPYAGTFKEWGAVWVTSSGGTLYENFFAAFEIHSTAPTARIGGAKLETPPQTFDGLNCQGYPQYGYGSFPPNPYQALIRRGGRTFHDKGVSNSEVDFGCVIVPPCITNGMKESFLSMEGTALVAGG